MTASSRRIASIDRWGLPRCGSDRVSTCTCNQRSASEDMDEMSVNVKHRGKPHRTLPSSALYIMICHGCQSSEKYRQLRRTGLSGRSGAKMRSRESAFAARHKTFRGDPPGLCKFEHSNGMQGISREAAHQNKTLPLRRHRLHGRS